MNSRVFYFELCRIMNSINNNYDKYAKKKGIESNNEFWILYYLSYGDGNTQLDICENCQLPKSTVNTIMKNLEKNGYVKLTKGKDKRQRLLSLTREGKEYSDKLLSDLFKREDKIFNINQNQLIKMIELMKKFDESLKILLN